MPRNTARALPGSHRTKKPPAGGFFRVMPLRSGAGASTARGCLQFTHSGSQTHDAPPKDRAEIISLEFVITRGDSAVVFQTGKSILNQVPDL